jgi:hypothetical protein
MPEHIKPAPVTLGRVAAYYRFLTQRLQLDEVLDAIHERATRAATRPQTLAEAAEEREGNEQAATTITMPMGVIWRALADQDIVRELADILFAREDGLPLTEDDADGISVEAVHAAFFTFSAESLGLSHLLAGSATSWG